MSSLGLKRAKSPSSKAREIFNDFYCKSFTKEDVVYQQVAD